MEIPAIQASDPSDFSLPLPIREMKEQGDSSAARRGAPEVGGPGTPDWRNLSDEVLLDLAKAAAPGDSRAFDELIRRHQGHIRANCRFIVKEPEASLDLAQEVFVKAYFALASFEGRSTWKTWLRRIKVNHCLSYRESRRNRPVWRLEDVDPGEGAELRVLPSAPDSLAAEDTRNRIMRTLDRIPETLRIPLVLRDMDGFSYEEIRTMLGLNRSAVKMRIMRGREAFREAWLEEEE